MKYEMGRATCQRHSVTATRRGRGRQHHSVGEWVSVSLSTLYLCFVLPLYLSISPLTSVSFFLLFPSFRVLLSPFSFGLLRVRAEFFFFLKIYMGHGLLAWPDDGLGFMIFVRGAGLKTQGPKPFFLKILLAKKIFFWTQGGPGPP